MQTITEQLRAAFVRSGWSIQELLDRSGLKLERSTLHRKIHGDTPLTVREAEVLARTLDVVIRFPRRRRAA